MDISWDDVRLFLAVAEARSLSGAARALRIGQPTVSRRLAALEYSLGEKLFRRSVEGAALTRAGELLLAPARRMAEWAGEVGRAAESSDRAPAGLVRITTTPFVAFDFLAPFAGSISKKHPGLRLEVLSSIQHLDLARGEADLALRLKPPSQPELKLLASVEFENGAFAAPSLAARLPRRPRVEDVPWIAWAPPYEQIPPNPQLEELIPGFLPAFTSDHPSVHVAAAEAGVGAVIQGRVQHRFSRRSSLVLLNVDLGVGQRGAIHLVCAKSALDIPRIRLVVDLLVAELQHARTL